MLHLKTGIGSFLKRQSAIIFAGIPSVDHFSIIFNTDGFCVDICRFIKMSDCEIKDH